MTRYIVKNIRRLLDEAFSDEELRSFCYDMTEFVSVYNQLKPTTSKVGVIKLLIEQVHRQSKVETLLAIIEEIRPAEYKKYQPYYDDESSLTSTLDIYEEFQKTEDKSKAKIPRRKVDLSGNTFIMPTANIKAAIIVQGGELPVNAPINVDMSETIVPVTTSDRQIMISIESYLDDVTQTIEALPNIDETNKNRLIHLMNQLKMQLALVPPDRARDAEKISKQVKDLVMEMNQEELDQEMVRILAEVLKQTAQKLTDVMPYILDIVTQVSVVVCSSIDHH